MAHIQHAGHKGTGFDMKGELQAYNAHLKTIPKEAAGALFTEVVGQAAYFLTYGYFPEQKIALLPGFDYWNIGVVDGYNVVDKQLVRDEEDSTERFPTSPVMTKEPDEDEENI